MSDNPLDFDYTEDFEQKKAYALLDPVRFLMLRRLLLLQKDLQNLHIERMKYKENKLKLRTVEKALTDLNDFISAYKQKREYAGKDKYTDFLKFKHGYFYPVSRKVMAARDMGSEWIWESRDGFNILQYEHWVDFCNFFVEDEGVTQFEIMGGKPKSVAFSNLSGA